MVVLEAFILSKTTIVGSPKLVVRVSRSCSVCTLTLWFMQLREINIDKESLISLFDIDLAIPGIFINVCLILLCVGSIDHKLLRYTIRLNDYIVHVNHML